MEDYIKSIGDINEKEYYFIIPDYQRGYRWGKEETIKLIDDIIDCEEKSYFLQPIAYRKEINGGFILVDGQQRLTTIYLILKIITNELPKYKLEYITRKESEKFLRSQENNENSTTIDTFHMSLVQDAIKTKIESEFSSDEDKKILKEKILNTKFIFYEVDEKEENNFFKRINIGKIYLTNGELVKALILNRKLYEEDNTNRQKQLKWATLWDEMEQSLHNEDFWCMLNNDLEKYNNTRIDLILEITARKIAKANNIEFDKNKRYWIFEIFEEYRKTNRDEGIFKMWDEIRKCYRTLKQWFDHHEIYHLLGYIISFENDTVKKLEELIELYEDVEQIKNKNDFINELYRQIKEMNKTITIKISDLEKYNKEKYNELGQKYGRQSTIEIKDSDTLRDICESLNYDNIKDKKAIKKILLLFNILTIIENNQDVQEKQIKEYKRFSFGCYKNQEWDIEHIHAKNEENAKTDISEKNIETLKKILDDNNRKELEEILIQNEANKDKNTIAFNKIYNKMLNKQKEMTETNLINSLQNLTLLDRKTNESYKDSVFIIKRYIILENDKKGEFIPICTKNVFLKYYSKNIEQIVCWSKEDGRNYLNQIIETIARSQLYKGDIKNEQ